MGEQTLDAHEVPLGRIRDGLIACLEHGDMRSVSALLRITREQLEARPTSETLVWASLGLAALIAFIGVAFDAESMPARAPKSHLILEFALLGAGLLAAYAATSRYLDRRDYLEKQTIRAWARSSLIAALSMPGLELRPLRKGEHQLLRVLAGKHGELLARAKPLLALGDRARRIDARSLRRRRHPRLDTDVVRPWGQSAYG